jgi:hypothetical protein
MPVTKPGVTNGGSTGSMRAEGGACAAYSQPQQGEEGADEGRHRHALKAAAGGEGEEQMDRGGGMQVARPMCMRMSERIRGYESTSSHPALMHEHVGAAAAGEAGLYLIASRARLSAMPTCMCISNVGMVGLRPVQSICSVRACGRVALARGHAGQEPGSVGVIVITFKRETAERRLRKSTVASRTINTKHC